MSKISNDIRQPNYIDTHKIESSGRAVIIKKTFDNIQSTHNEIIDNPQKKEELIFPKKKKILMILLSVLLLLIISAIILIIGHFKLGWFMKKNDLILVQNRELNLVGRYKEKKYATNYYDLEGLDQNKKVQNINISTDFIVGINKRTKINSIFDLSEPDYLYESFLLVLNFTEINDTNYEFLGGINVFDESKSAEDLIRINDQFFLKLIKNANNSININKTDFKENFPICKFYYFENGTIDEIYFPEGMNEFYKTAISDLIEKITPKLSKSLYQKEETRRRLKNEKGEEESLMLNYEQILENGVLKKTIIYEDKSQKVFNDKRNVTNMERNEINSKIIRTFNSSGDIISLKMEGEALFKSFSSETNNNIKNIQNKNLRIIEETEKKHLETNESYYNLGFNEFNMNVTSNMELINNEINKKIIDKLNEISNLIKFEIYKESNESLINNEGKEKELNNSDESPFESNSTKEKRNLAKKNIINYSSPYTATYRLFTTDFLGTKIGLKQYLIINEKTNLRQEYLELLYKNREYILAIVTKYHYSNLKSGYITKELINKDFGLDKYFKPFGFSIKASLKLVIDVEHGVSFDIINGEMYSKGYASFNIGVSGSFGPDFFFISFGASLTGYVVRGSSYIQGNTLLNSGSKLAKFHFHSKLNTCSVDLSFYFTINLIFWEKTYKQTYNLYKGFSSYDDTYLYG